MHVRLLLLYSCQGTKYFASAGPAHAFAKLFAEIALLVASLRLRQREETYIFQRVCVLIVAAILCSSCFVLIRVCLKKKEKERMGQCALLTICYCKLHGNGKSILHE